MGQRLEDEILETVYSVAYIRPIEANKQTAVLLENFTGEV